MLIFKNTSTISLLGSHLGGGAPLFIYSTSKLLVQNFNLVRGASWNWVTLGVLSVCIMPAIYQACCHVWGLKDTVVPWRLKAVSAKGHTYLNNNRDLLALAMMWDKNLPWGGLLHWLFWIKISVRNVLIFNLCAWWFSKKEGSLDSAVGESATEIVAPSTPRERPLPQCCARCLLLCRCWNSLARGTASVPSRALSSPGRQVLPVVRCTNLTLLWLYKLTLLYLQVFVKSSTHRSLVQKMFKTTNNDQIYSA